MRAAPRGKKPSPKSLSNKNKAGETELERARAHYTGVQMQKETFTFAAYKADEVKQRLDELFFGKCAYCESRYASTAPVDVEHFRPKGAVEGTTHPGYWWIAMAWDNLLPSCIDCNRKRKQITPRPSSSLVTLDAASRSFSAGHVVQSGKKDSFPVTGTHVLPEGSDFASEGALLLDPCRDDPSLHLEFYVDRANPISLVLPRLIGPAEGAAPGPPSASVRGAVSIQVYGLNRLGLVQDRTRVLRHLDFLETLIVELGEIIERLSDPALADAVRRLQLLQERILQEIKMMAEPQAPYSAMVAAWIVAFKAHLASANAGQGAP